MLLSHLSAAWAAVLTNQPVLQCKRANLPEAGNLQNSILSLEMLSLYSAARGTCPLVPSCRHYDWVQRKLELRRYVDMFWHNTDRQTRPRLSVLLQCRRTDILQQHRPLHCAIRYAQSCQLKLCFPMSNNACWKVVIEGQFCPIINQFLIA